MSPQDLEIEIAPYRILGACNPQLAAQALDAEPDVGLLLPCNVVLYDDGGQTVVAILDPLTMIQISGNSALKPVASDARARLERVVAGLDDAYGGTRSHPSRFLQSLEREPPRGHEDRTAQEREADQPVTVTVPFIQGCGVQK